MPKKKKTITKKAKRVGAKTKKTVSKSKTKKTTKAKKTNKKTKKTSSATRQAARKTKTSTRKPAKASTKKKTVKKKTGKKKTAAATTTRQVKVKKLKKAPSRRFVKRTVAVPEPEKPSLTIGQLRKVKTDLSKRDLAQFRQLLLEKRKEILGDVEAMETDARGKNAGGNLSNMPVHMADVGSDNYEQEFTLGLVESERRLVREIDEALQRIEDKIYGVCLERGVPIARPRLEAKPWAKYCIEVARERERQGLS